MCKIINALCTYKMKHVCKIIDPLTVYIQPTMKVTFCKHLKVCYDKVSKKNYIYIYISHMIAHV